MVCRGVNFPYPQASLPSFDDPVWEPLFATCAERSMPLTTHIGVKMLPPISHGPATTGLRLMESPFVCGRGLWHLVLAGVFDRHPTLQFVIAECPGIWWLWAINEMDSIYDDQARGGPAMRAFLSRRPSEYVQSNVHFCESFQSKGEAQAAIDSGFVGRVMWGSDYPHIEETWMQPNRPSDPSTTRLSMANTFAGLREADVRMMAGLNVVVCYGLDGAALSAVAAQIGPTLAELTTPPDLTAVPADYMGLGFRKSGAMS
jgi:hypothetical protein